MDRLVGSFEAARMLGFTALEAQPKRGQRVANETYQRDLNALAKAIERGTVPKPDRKRGRKNLWRLSTLKKHVAENGQTKEVTDASAA